MQEARCVHSTRHSPGSHRKLDGFAQGIGLQHGSHSGIGGSFEWLATKLGKETTRGDELLLTFGDEQTALRELPGFIANTQSLKTPSKAERQRGLRSVDHLCHITLPAKAIDPAFSATLRAPSRMPVRNLASVKLCCTHSASSDFISSLTFSDASLTVSSTPRVIEGSSR